MPRSSSRRGRLAKWRTRIECGCHCNGVLEGVSDSGRVTKPATGWEKIIWLLLLLATLIERDSTLDMLWSVFG